MLYLYFVPFIGFQIKYDDDDDVTPVGGRMLPGRVCGGSGGRHCKAGQYGYVPLGRHLVLNNSPISMGYSVFDFYFFHYFSFLGRALD